MGVPLGQWSGSESTDKLRETIERLNVESERQTKIMVRLTDVGNFHSYRGHDYRRWSSDIHFSSVGSLKTWVFQTYRRGRKSEVFGPASAMLREEPNLRRNGRAFAEASFFILPMRVGSTRH